MTTGGPSEQIMEHECQIARSISDPWGEKCMIAGPTKTDIWVIDANQKALEILLRTLQKTLLFTDLRNTIIARTFSVGGKVHVIQNERTNDIIREFERPNKFSILWMQN